VGPTIVSDYISLFVVRKCLAISAIRLRLSAPIVVTAVAGAVVVVTNIGQVFASMFSYKTPTMEEIMEDILMNINPVTWIDTPGMLWVVIPALLVHLWLPLFLLAGTVTYGLNAFFRAV